MVPMAKILKINPATGPQLVPVTEIIVKRTLLLIRSEELIKKGKLERAVGGLVVYHPNVLLYSPFCFVLLKGVFFFGLGVVAKR
jgi:hypothetical protein